MSFQALSLNAPRNCVASKLRSERARCFSFPMSHLGWNRYRVAPSIKGMAFVSHSLLIVNAPETRRPSVGLRHYIPLFFLAPSLLMLVHAWNRTAPPQARVFVEIDSGGFEFPRDVRLEVEHGAGQVAPVGGRHASFVAPEPGSLLLSLFVRRAAGGVRVRVGAPASFELTQAEESTRWTLQVSASECIRALEELRATR